MARTCRGTGQGTGQAGWARVQHLVIRGTCDSTWRTESKKIQEQERKELVLRNIWFRLQTVNLDFPLTCFFP